MNKFREFSYQFTDGAETNVVATLANHNIGIGVLIEFQLPEKSARRRIKFVSDPRNPESLLFVRSKSNEELLNYAINRFVNEEWGDRLASSNGGEEHVHVEPI
jgi:hypothetical protein